MRWLISIAAPLFLVMISTGVGLMFGVGSFGCGVIHLSREGQGGAYQRHAQAVVVSSLTTGGVQVS